MDILGIKHRRKWLPQGIHFVEGAWWYYGKDRRQRITTTRCPDCGKERVVSTHGTLCKSCANKGERNPRWVGTKIKRRSAYARAQVLFALGDCELCGNTADYRHHKDGDPRNNDPNNIQIVCKGCHNTVIHKKGRDKHGKLH